MKKPLNNVRVVGLVALIIALMLGCQRDGQDLVKQNNAQLSVQTAAENSAVIANAQDAVNLTANAMVSQGIAYGRTADEGEDDDDPECRPTITNNIKVDRSHLDTLIISGTIIIDFGTGTTCDSVHVKKGSITDSIMMVVVFKTRTMFTSFEKITFNNYWRDSVQMDGSISVRAATGTPTVVTIDGSKIKYHDGTSTSWSGNMVFTYQRDSSGHRTIEVTGSWSGTTRNGTSFSANITKTILFKAGCFEHRGRFIPVSGTVDITSNGTASTIDFGDGTCDRVYTITTGGVTTQHRLT